MSLNGLDVNAVVEAHQSALADPGGWFLLKYVNRDTVDVLARGNGGVTEAKNSVERYQEKSPLFGMVQYRRKRVLLKFVPDGTSRLLQVRLTVQFHSILDAFPHDTVFSFTAAAELVESALGMCTMLLPITPGPLRSSNSSLRQRRLNEISEDAEETSILPRKQEPVFVQPVPLEEKRVVDNDDMSSLPASAVRAKAMLAKRREESRNASLASNNINLSTPVSQPPPNVETSPADPESRPSLSSLGRLKLRNEAQPITSASRIDTQMTEHLPKRFHHSRHLSENESESISQWNEGVTAYALAEPLPKPKKKLAPRPHVEINTRPKTAVPYEENVSTRPIANLPQSVRVSTRPNTSAGSTIRPSSQQSSRSVPARFLFAQDLPPPLPELGHLEPLLKRPESRKAGSVVSSTITDAQNASPEKLRLMKALQKRKRTQMLTQRTPSAQSNLTTYREDSPLRRIEVNEASPAEQIPTTIKEEAAPTAQLPKSINDSSTASPTSIGTMSDNPSTRPSSVADDQQSRVSQKSPSHDTDSSSTPRAAVENDHSANDRQMNWYGPAPAFGSENRQGVLITPPKGLRDEAVESRNSRTPTLRDPQIDHAEVIQQMPSTLSWLANDTQLNNLQSLMQVAESHTSNQNLNPNTLSVEAFASPNLSTSSFMSDDDSLAEELRSATVHEATSMSVKRPPLTPTMRTVSIDRSRPGTGNNLTPKSSKSMSRSSEKSAGPNEQSPSTALPQWPSGTDEEPMAVAWAKKSNLADGISQRIKALEDSSRRDTMSFSVPANDSPLGRSAFSNLMKRASIIAQFPAPGGSTDRTPSDDISKSEASDKSRALRVSVPRKALPTSSTKPRENIESSPATIRVTQAQPKSPTRIDVDHSNASTPKLSHLPDYFPTPVEGSSTPASERKRFSFTSYRSGSTTPARKWMQHESMSSKISLSNKEAKSSRTTGSETSSVHDDKRGSRASRLMKRVSGFGGRFGGKGQQSTGSRDETRPHPILEQNEALARPVSNASSTLQTIDIGNVNVQFPETLLWKRRFLRIDDQGYIIFSTPIENNSVRATSRKFHLADVQEPCLPDQEREEIAWSVLLDLRDGNCIQCACESKKGQRKVLNMLLDAHSAYHSLYPDALE